MKLYTVASVRNDAIKDDEVFCNLALLNNSSPNPSSENALKEEVVSCLTYKPAEDTHGVNVESPSKHSVFGRDFIPANEPEQESMPRSVSLKPERLVPRNNIHLVPNEFYDI